MESELRILMLEDCRDDAELVKRELHSAGVVFTDKLTAKRYDEITT